MRSLLGHWFLGNHFAVCLKQNKLTYYDFTFNFFHNVNFFSSCHTVCSEKLKATKRVCKYKESIKGKTQLVVDKYFLPQKFFPHE